jgi:membrane protease YdiL (CAAX protease family)
MNEYLDLARLGKNDWWRFVLAVLVIFVAWQLVGAAPTILLVLWIVLDGNLDTLVTTEGGFQGVDVNLSFTAMMLASVAFVGGIFLTIRFLHQRRFVTLVTPRRRLDWRRFLQGFSVWFVLCAVIGGVEALLFPGRYVFSLDPVQYSLFFVLALVLIPIQTSAEELFFRGYILQGFGLRLRNIYVLSALSGLLFMLPHLLNPEAKLNYLLMGLSYFSIGAVLAYITLRDGRLELALGLHAANNLFTALLANAVVTVLPTPALFTVMELDVVYSTVATLIALLLFVLVFTLRSRGRETEQPGDAA